MKALILPHYLIGQFLKLVFFVTLALAGILLVFDLLGNIVAVTSHHHHLLYIVSYYIVLRFPSILTLALPLGVLLATMILLARLALSREITALFASGVTIYYIAIVLSMGALVPATAHFLLSNSLVPDTASRLDAWAKNDFNGPPPAEGRTVLPAWFAAGNDLVQAQGANRDGRLLQKVTIIRRDASGVILDYYRADHARYDNNQWQLYKVDMIDARTNRQSMRDQLTLDLTLQPGNLSAMGNGVTEIGVATLWRAVHDPLISSKPNPLYSLWLQRKVAEPLESLIMVLLATPLAFQLTRRNSILSASFGVIAAGFAYFVAERLLLSLGEAEILSPAIAVWSPPVFFAMMSWWFLLYKQE